MWPDYRLALNGHIILVLRNHDGERETMLDDVGFDGVETNAVIEVDGVALWLNHYPVVTPDDAPKFVSVRLRPANTTWHSAVKSTSFGGREPAASMSESTSGISGRSR